MLEDQIMNEIDNNWLKYNKNKKSKIEDEIIGEYIDILNFYDSEYPNIKKDDITPYNLTKTIILNNLKDDLIHEIKKSTLFDKILKAYYNQKEK